MTRHARRVDENHGLIRDALRAAGYEVLDLSGVGGGIPDLAVKIGVGKSVFLELKRAGIKKREQALTVHQEIFLYYFHSITHVVQTPEEALEAVEWAKKRG